MAALPLTVEADSGAGWISPPTAQDCQVCRQETQGCGVPQPQAVPILGWGDEKKAGQQACPEAVVETG